MRATFAAGAVALALVLVWIRTNVDYERAPSAAAGSAEDSSGAHVDNGRAPSPAAGPTEHSAGAPPETATATSPAAGPPSPLPSGFYLLDPMQFKDRFPTAESLDWAVGMIPFVDLPPNNYSDVLAAYYYRARSYRKHVVWTGKEDGYVVTEFLPNVGWAGKHNTIPAAAGHHILEGRWFHDERILDDYIRFWYREGSGRDHIASYTNWILTAAWQRSLVTGNASIVEGVVQEAADVFRSIYIPQYLSNSSANSKRWGKADRVCWVQDDGRDAMEVSVSGYGCRPTIASALFGEASVISATAKSIVRGGGGSANAAALADEFERWANFSRSVVLDQLWNPSIGSFAVISPPIEDAIGRHRTGTSTGTIMQESATKACDLESMRPPNRCVPVRELLAFAPWYFGAHSPLGSLIPPDLAHMYASQFRYLLESAGRSGFSAKWGLRTLERGCPCYNYSWDHGDCWNGPSWPYETSRVLTAAANLLNQYPASVAEEGGMNREVFDRLVRQYARQHTATSAINDTAKPKGSGHVFEVLHPDDGYWIDRQQLYAQKSDLRNMGDDYNHSTFLDLVLSFLLGILPGKDIANSTPGSPWLTINPLIDPQRTSFFAADHVKYRGHILTVFWDKDGTKYRKGSGLSVMIDGVLVASRDDLGQVDVPAPGSLKGSKLAASVM